MLKSRFSKSPNWPHTHAIPRRGTACSAPTKKHPYLGAIGNMTAFPQSPLVTERLLCPILTTLKIGVIMLKKERYNIYIVINFAFFFYGALICKGILL